MAVATRSRAWVKSARVVFLVDAIAAVVLGVIDDSASSILAAAVYLALLVTMPMALVASLAFYATRGVEGRGAQLLVCWASLAGAWVIVLPIALDGEAFVAPVCLVAHLVAGVVITRFHFRETDVDRRD